VVDTEGEGDQLLKILWNPRGPHLQICALQSAVTPNLTTTAYERECYRTDRRIMLLVSLEDL